MSWRQRITHRNRKIATYIALITAAELYFNTGLTLQAVPDVAASIWVIGFLFIHLRWKAREEDGLAAMREELRRQGRTWRHGWLWCVAPIAASIVAPGPFIPWIHVPTLALLAFFGFKLWKQGQALIASSYQ